MTKISLHQCPNSPCLFSGSIIPNQPPIYTGIYVDDCIYFSTSDEVEKVFETRLRSILKDDISFMGPVTHFLGIKFDSFWDNNNSLSIYMSQPAFIDALIQTTNLQSANPTSTPYRNGFPVNSIKLPTTPASKSTILQMRRIVGSLLWLSQSPDMTTITNLLASYQTNPSP